MRIAVLVALLAFLAYWSNALTPPLGDANTHVYLAYSFVFDGDAYLDEYADVRPPFAFWGQQDPPPRRSPYLPGTALLFSPLALVAGLGGAPPDSVPVAGGLGKLLASTLVALSVACVYLMTVDVLPRRAALFLTFAYAFGTSAFATASQALLQHGPSIGLLALALLIVLRGEGSRHGGAVAGLPLALAVLVRPTDAFLAVAVALFVLHRRRHAFVRFVLWGLGPAAFLLIYNALTLGSPVRIAGGEVTHASSLWEGVVGLLASPSRGLLVYSPFLAVGLAAFVAAWRGRADDRTWLLRYGSPAFLATLFLYGSYSQWWGSWTFGDRYLSDLLPLYALGLAEAWRRGWFASALARAALAAATGWAVLLNSAGALLFYLQWNGYHWDLTPDINETPWRLWSWTDTQWQFVLRRLVTDPGPAMLVELAVVLYVLVVFAYLSKREPLAERFRQGSSP